MKDSELQQIVEKISIDFFGKPFVHQATFNHRLRTTGGRYLTSTHCIEINKRYLDHFGKTELYGIIKHELCHCHLHLAGKGYHHRDADFKKLLNEVGAPRFCSELPSSKRNKYTKRYQYSCLECDTIYIRKRRVNTTRFVCGKCNGQIQKKSSD